MAEIYVVGSGPAAISCAHALVSQGHPVTILDAGVELEPERQQIVREIRRQQPEEWDPKLLNTFKDGAGATGSGVPIKRVYGSDFPYRYVRDHLRLHTENVTAFSSFARGGLSNVWGAAVLPYQAQDIDAWPVSRAQLTPYYERVFEFMPLAAVHDDLEQRFPLHAHTIQALKPSVQARTILERSRRHHDSLLRQGFTVGQSRLAIAAEHAAEDGRCVYCGLCMYGCPQDVIYNASHTLAHLLRTGRVRYIPNIVVDTVEENEAAITIHAHARTTGQQVEFTGDRIFLGAGVISTAHIMLRSHGFEGAELRLLDSQYFLLPLLALFGAAGVEREKLHTLAQVYIELDNPLLGHRPAHLQVYTYNDLYDSAMRNMLKAAYSIAGAPARLALNRLLVIQGYLHSDFSSGATLAYRNSMLTLTRTLNPRAGATVRTITRLLRQNRHALGFVPLSPLLNLGNPGQGAHIGGTFPMRHTPDRLETDVLGRPASMSRLHIVDGSVLPSIPATTITLSVMANAYRIGSEALLHG
jgi:choline dehydrogenase-like flavoprotein